MNKSSSSLMRNPVEYDNKTIPSSIKKKQYINETNTFNLLFSCTFAELSTYLKL